MSPTILRNQGLNTEHGSMEVASLEGYDVFFSPSINLVPSPEAVVYGVLGDFTPDECNVLFSQKRFSRYREAMVAAKKKDGLAVAASCHFDSQAEKLPPTKEYVDRLVVIAKSYQFPSWYIEHLRKVSLAG